MDGLSFKIGIATIILAFCLAVTVMKCYNKNQIIHTSTDADVSITEPDSIDVIDTTEIMIDKKLFVCVGDIDLDVSEVGVVQFDCQTEEKKVHIVTNPQDMFVTQYFKRVMR